MSVTEGNAITFEKFLELVPKTGKMRASLKEEEVAIGHRASGALQRARAEHSRARRPRISWILFIAVSLPSSLKVRDSSLAPPGRDEGLLRGGEGHQDRRGGRTRTRTQRPDGCCFGPADAAGHRCAATTAKAAAAWSRQGGVLPVQESIWRAGGSEDGRVPALPGRQPAAGKCNTDRPGERRALMM